MAWKYKRIMPIVLGARLELLEPKAIIDLIGRSFDNAYSALTKTSYQKEIFAISSKNLNATSIEHALLKNYIRVCEEVRDASPKDIQFLLSAIMKKFEVNNVKSILRATWADINIEEAIQYLIPVGSMDEKRCQHILENSNNLGNVIDLLSDLEYGLVLQKALQDLNETRELPIIEVALDRLVYERIQKAVNKLKGRDRKIAEKILGMEVDSINIKTILRCQSLGINKDQIKKYLLTSKTFDQKVLERGIEKTDIKNFIEALLLMPKKDGFLDYNAVLKDLLKEYEASHSLSQLEIALDKNLLKTHLMVIKKYTPYFNIGLILAFINAKWIEIRNLKAIFIGAENKMAPEKILKYLILPN